MLCGCSFDRGHQCDAWNGYWAGPVDGVFGPLTEQAVINFQVANKILIDGIAGNQTLSLLYSTDSSYATNLYWLSRIIHAEAGAESYNGKVAVGNVILNRVNSDLFPSTVKGVIFEYFQGIPQFSPVEEGTIYNNPPEESIQAYYTDLSDAQNLENEIPNPSAYAGASENDEFFVRIENSIEDVCYTIVQINLAPKICDLIIEDLSRTL